MRELIRATARLVALAAGTLVSEDLTCLSAGLLIRSGALGAATGLLGCFVGIVAGDAALYAVGRVLGDRLRHTAWLHRWVAWERIERAEAWMDGNLPRAILTSRFLPGTRLPLYLAAGMLSRHSRRFLLWALIAAAAWTPVVVLSSAWLGGALIVPLGQIAGVNAAWRVPLAGLAAFLLWRATALLVRLLRSGPARARAITRIAILWRWEFWPTWLFYLPVAPWIGWLSIRHRGFNCITAANPSMPDGGFVGESKSAILDRLPQEWTAPHAVVESAPSADRLTTLRRIMKDRGWCYPIILKPDVGQRGDAVRLIADEASAAVYLARFTGLTIAQVYHPGPFEAGIFYYRMPGTEHGRILSLTDKKFPVVVGDGRARLEELVWAHPRYRMQADTFLGRLGPRRFQIPARGEPVRLCVAGNHSQGTMFRDGRDLITPALEQRVDRIARSVKGFYFGRFDVRYADPVGFREGTDLTIVELNGVTSESTNIYDPGRGLVAAYRTLQQATGIPCHSCGLAGRLDPAALCERKGSGARRLSRMPIEEGCRRFRSHVADQERPVDAEQVDQDEAIDDASEFVVHVEPEQHAVEAQILPEEDGNAPAVRFDLADQRVDLVEVSRHDPCQPVVENARPEAGRVPGPDELPELGDVPVQPKERHE